MVNGDDSEVIQECHFVTGGGGYVGRNICRALIDKGHQVVLLDVQDPHWEVPQGARFVKVDMRDASSVQAALKGAHCVYHVASYGMSGREQLNKKLIEEVNVEGTKNVIKACVHWNIERLVYTSTYNVVFGGQEIKNGDESLPYLPLDKHPDHYSRTKAIAEMAVLEANGTTLPSGATLKTCALRLAGVYGPGEQRHLPRIVGLLEQGLVTVVYGAVESQVDFLHIDNLVQAHVKAGEALSASRKHVAAGQPYFISDCKPVNNFEFFRPLIEGLDFKYPSIRLPVTLVFYIAFLIEVLHSIVGRVYNFQPLLTRTEVYKTGVTHYFSNEKARRDLGYVPTVQNDLGPAVDWFKGQGHGKKMKQSSNGRSFLLDVILAFLFAVIVMSFLPVAK